MFEPLISEKEAISIKYLPQSQILLALSDLREQNRVPLLLVNHFQQKKGTYKQDSEYTRKLGANDVFIQLQSGLDSIGEQQCELWIGSGQWQYGHKELDVDVDLSFCSNENTLIGSVSIPLEENSSLQNLSQLYYKQIIDFISEQSKQHLLRMWNYFPDINQSGHVLERYQEFCIGRHNAFASGATKEFDYPAASAVGSASQALSPKMVIIFIATHESGLFLENPDQISAYQYPSHYSPKSPSFARASIYHTGKLQQLHISGTASIVGHESKFHGDIINQTHQTIKNLKRLIKHGNEECAQNEQFSLMSSSAGAPIIKVYLRNPADKEIVAPIIQAFTPDTQYICYLQADVCRQELDIEIEMLLNSQRE